MIMIMIMITITDIIFLPHFFEESPRVLLIEPAGSPPGGVEGPRGGGQVGGAQGDQGAHRRVV
jgi:hypothetical protein